MMDGEHLPECWLAEGKFDAVCMCDRLRACEQRVLDRLYHGMESKLYALRHE